MPDILEHVLDFVGATLEVIGALYLANRYFGKVIIWQIPWALISTLWRGKAAVGMAFGGEISSEDAFSSLKGILYLILGFSVRSSPHVIHIVEYAIEHAKRH